MKHIAKLFVVLPIWYFTMTNPATGDATFSPGFATQGECLAQQDLAVENHPTFDFIDCQSSKLKVCGTPHTQTCPPPQTH